MMGATREAESTAAEDRPHLGDAAQRYAMLGWHVFPCRGKRGMTEHGHLDATTDSHQIDAWWEQWSGANIGMACNTSGVFVIDVDPRHSGDATLAALLQQHGPLPLTVESAAHLPTDWLKESGGLR